MMLILRTKGAEGEQDPEQLTDWWCTYWSKEYPVGEFLIVFFCGMSHQILEFSVQVVNSVHDPAQI